MPSPLLLLVLAVVLTGVSSDSTKGCDESLLTAWSPWSEKDSNVYDGCGTRRRMRGFIDQSAMDAANENINCVLYEHKETCKYQC